MKSLRPPVARSASAPFAGLLAGVLVLAACGGADDASSSGTVNRPTINVGRTTDPASELLAEIYGQGLENAGFRVGRKDPVADRAATIAALEAGTVQFVPEFSSTLLAHLTTAGSSVTAVTVDDQLAALRTALPATLTAGPATAAEGTTVVACSQAAVGEHSLKTVSDLAGVVADVTLGGPAAFETAELFGLAALDAAYEVEFTFVPVGDAAVGAGGSQLSAKLADGTIDCAGAPQTWATITVDGLIALDDDKTAFPLDVVVPLMTTAAATPDVVAVVTQLNATITTDVLRALLVKLAVGDQSYDVIAKQFLESQAPAQ
ncbi:MAG: glycine betaine ABC transporter substrate-binding protein [Actinomycetota bacterium]